MLVHLSHSDLRAFAKSLRDLIGRDVRHSQILEDVAASVGLKPDAMMHRLKTAQAAAGGLRPSPSDCLRLDDDAVKALAGRLSRRTGGSPPVGPGDVEAKLHAIVEEAYSSTKDDGRVLVYDEYHLALAAQKPKVPHFLLLRYAQDATVKLMTSEELAHFDVFPIGNGWNKVVYRDAEGSASADRSADVVAPSS